MTEAATFDSLGLEADLLSVIGELGYEEPTPIQRLAIPAILSGRDVIGQAATGTGKTAAFALPALQLIGRSRPAAFSANALIIVPTRELAIQVAEATHTYGKKMEVGVLPIYGGQPISQQLRRLRSGVHVVIATPGRALDHVRRKTLKLDSVQTVVVDEADELLDLGFTDDLDALLAEVPASAQVALFSATLPPRIAALAERHLENPQRIKIEANAKKAETTPKISQVAYVIPRAHKEIALGRVLDLEDPSTAIIFCRTRLEVEHLTDSLTAHGYNCAALHGGLDQPMRDRVIRKFKGGEVELLIATDVAARGLDVEKLTHVVNYDVPSSPEDYVHRIGRTGRAGREGKAITFCEPKEHRFLRVLESVTGGKIEVARVPTVVDLRNRRLEITRASVEEALGSEGLDKFRSIAEALSANTEPLDIAAAAIAALHKQLAPSDSEDEREIPEFKPGQGKPPRPELARRDRPREERERHKPGTRLFVSIGRNFGLRPADLVGAIANEAGLSREEIGAIQIAERHAFVEVAEDRAEKVIETLKNTTIRGRKVRVDRDRGPSAPNPGRRDEGEGRRYEKRPSTDDDFVDAPRSEREHAPPRRPFAGGPDAAKPERDAKKSEPQRRTIEGGPDAPRHRPFRPPRNRKGGLGGTPRKPKH